MKRFTNLLMVLLTVFAAFSNTITAFAATNPSDGTITIENAVKGEIYNIYKVFDLTYSGNKVSYTVDSDWEDFFKSSGNTYNGAKYIVSEDVSGSLNPITHESAIRYINITESNVAEFSKDALKYVVSKNLTNDKSATAASSTVEFTDLSLGYYLVYNGLTEVTDNYTTIVSLTSTMNNAVAYRKATNPEIDKDIVSVEDNNGHTLTNSIYQDNKSANVQVGDKVNYEITGTVGDTDGYSRYDYVVTDTMTTGTTYNNDVVVKIKTTSTSSAYTLTIGDTYTNKTTADTYTTTNCNTYYYEKVGNGFKVTLDLTKLKAGTEISIKYSATVNESAINNVNKNSAVLTYPTDPKDLSKTASTKEVNTYVYTTALDAFKVEAKAQSSTTSSVYSTYTKVSGATFVLKATDGNNSGRYYKYTDSKVEWVEKETAATYYTTDDNGLVTFKGLLPGNYDLIETDAPVGYNLSPYPVKVTITNTANSVEAKSGNVTYTLALQSGNQAPAQIKTSTATVSTSAVTNIATYIANFTGTVLPSTGGFGTTMFVVVGSLLMIGAIITLITNKKSEEM